MSVVVVDKQAYVCFDLTQHVRWVAAVVVLGNRLGPTIKPLRQQTQRAAANTSTAQVSVSRDDERFLKVNGNNAEDGAANSVLLGGAEEGGRGMPSADVSDTRLD